MVCLDILFKDELSPEEFIIFFGLWPNISNFLINARYHPNININLTTEGIFARRCRIWLVEK